MASGFKRDDAVRRLGGERVRPYLAAADGNDKRALALYRWNVGVSVAFRELLSLVEVVVRNALDEHLSQWCRTNGGYHDWLLHPDELPTPYAKAEAVKTDRDARPGHPPVVARAPAEMYFLKSPSGGMDCFRGTTLSGPTPRPTRIARSLGTRRRRVRLTRLPPETSALAAFSTFVLSQSCRTS